MAKITKAQRELLDEALEGAVVRQSDRPASALFDAGLVTRRSYSVGSVKPRYLVTITEAGRVALSST